MVGRYLKRFIATSEKLLPIIKDPEKRAKFKHKLNTWKEKLNIMAKKPKPVKKPKVQTAGDPVPPDPTHPPKP